MLVYQRVTQIHQPNSSNLIFWGGTPRPATVWENIALGLGPVDQAVAMEGGIEQPTYWFQPSEWELIGQKWG